MARGFFVTLEGGEGAGKSTQIRKLESALREQGRDVLVTREPGGTEAGEALRGVFVSHDGQDWPLAAQVLLMMAARALHIEQTIKPALAQGKIVLCDRFSDSTRAYQGIVQGFGVDKINDIGRQCFGAFEPDLSFILDVDPAIGRARLAHRKSAETFDKSADDFHAALQAAYRAIAAADPARCILIDAAQPAEAVFAQMLAAIGERLS